MVNEKESTRISKFLSLVLRHQPESIGLVLDKEGWASVDELLEKSGRAGTPITAELLLHIVETNPKKRFAFNDGGDKIRASQGHSVAVSLGYTPQTPPETLYHGTGTKNVASILAQGIEKRGRQHVHLSRDRATAEQVGQRHGKPYVFEIPAARMHRDGYEFFLSENGVWLTDAVPASFLNPAADQPL